MKHFVKTSKVPRLGKQIKQLVEKLNETSEEVTKRRSTVSFSPKDIQQVVRVLTIKGSNFRSVKASLYL
jgi:hypothetical protein